MKLLKNIIVVEYTPYEIKKTDSGIYLPREDALDFLELKTKQIGVEVEGRVEEGDTILIRKESLFQFELGEELIFSTMENLLLLKNGEPHLNKILLKKDDGKRETESGIYYKESSKNADLEVISVGGEVENINPGDRILIEKLFLLETDYGYIVNEEDVLGIYKL